MKIFPIPNAFKARFKQHEGSKTRWKGIIAVWIAVLNNREVIIATNGLTYSQSDGNGVKTPFFIGRVELPRSVSSFKGNGAQGMVIGGGSGDVAN